MKNNRHGQGTALEDWSYQKIRESLTLPHYKLLFDIAWYTGERWGAICQLKVEDVYADPGKLKPHAHITYRAVTRKDGATRQIPIHKCLRQRLAGYKPPQDGYLFPSPINSGQPISLRAADRALREAIAEAGLSEMGYSTHSTRRGFITSLHNAGASLRVIQSLTGHRSLGVLSRYVEVTEIQRERALHLL